MHVTTVATSLPHLCENLLVHLSRAGYEVAAVSSPGPEVVRLSTRGIPHWPVPMTRRVTPLTDLRSLWSLYALFKRERPAIVHTHTPKANLLGQLAARLAGVPVRVSTVHGLYFTTDTPPPARTMFHIVESWSARFADVLFLVNREDAETVRKRRLCLSSKVRLLGGGTGVDLQRFRRERIGESTLRRLRAALGLDPSCEVVGFVGRLVIEKGVVELLQAARALKNRRPRLRFLFVGPPDDEKGIGVPPSRAGEWGLDDVCIFTGPRDDLPELYALMDLVVLPSHREGCPRVLMEAAAMGLPSVTTDVRGCREVVQHGGTGLIVPKGDVQALTDALCWLLDHPQEARRLGEHARRSAQDRFDEQSVFEKIQGEYACLLEAKGITLPPSAMAPVFEAAG